MKFKSFYKYFCLKKIVNTHPIPLEWSFKVMWIYPKRIPVYGGDGDSMHSYGGSITASLPTGWAFMPYNNAFSMGAQCL